MARMGSNASRPDRVLEPEHHGLWLELVGRVEGLLFAPLSAQTLEVFLESSRLKLASFNQLMGALAEVEKALPDFVSPDLVVEALRVVDEDVADDVEMSLRSVRDAWECRERLYGTHWALMDADDGNPLHSFHTLVLWNAWSLACLGFTTFRPSLPRSPEILSILVRLLRETARGAYVALRTVELEAEESNAASGDHESSTAFDPESIALEAEAHEMAQEALQMAEQRA